MYIFLQCLKHRLGGVGGYRVIKLLSIQFKENLWLPARHISAGSPRKGCTERTNQLSDSRVYMSVCYVVRAATA